MDATGRSSARGGEEDGARARAPAAGARGGLRVALIDPGDFSPPYDAALAGGLRAVGCRVRLWGMAGQPAADDAGDKVGHFYRPLAGRTGRLLPRALHPAAKGLLHGFDLHRLVHALEADRTDIVHFQWTPLPLLDRRAVARLRRRTPVVLTVHNSRPYNGARGGPLVWGLEQLLATADALVVHTEEARTRLVGAGLPPERVHKIPHGLLQLVPVAEPRVPDLERPLRVLLLGSIKPYKGADVLIEALARLSPATRARLRVTIAGKPFIDLGPLRERIAGADLDGTVELRPRLLPDTEVNELLAEADLLVLPYRSIDASGVSMSAVAAGRPVIASALPGFVELFGGGRGAILVPPEDPAALARAFEAVAAEPDRLVELARSMLELRASIPSWTEIARRTLVLYEQLLAERRPAVAVGTVAAPSAAGPSTVAG